MDLLYGLFGYCSIGWQHCNDQTTMIVKHYCATWLWKSGFVYINNGNMTHTLQPRQAKRHSPPIIVAPGQHPCNQRRCYTFNSFSQTITRGRDLKTVEKCSPYYMIEKMLLIYVCAVVWIYVMISWWLQQTISDQVRIAVRLRYHHNPRHDHSQPPQTRHI